jgi:hypothetical protein
MKYFQSDVFCMKYNDESKGHGLHLADHLQLQMSGITEVEMSQILFHHSWPFTFPLRYACNNKYFLYMDSSKDYFV